MKTFNDLTGLYSLSKTLRFELKPVGKTKDNIETKGIIAQDEKRAEEYKKVKDIIDRYHKKFIEMCLANLKLKTISDGNNDSLKEYVTLASKANKDEKEDNDFKDVKTALRKQIVDAFKKGGSYSDLFKKELIQVHLPDFVTDEQEKQMVENFGKFTTYFTGFNENRQNMYSDEEKSTSIAYRLIHENLPMFIDNIKSFAKIAEHEDIDFLPDIENGFKEELKSGEFILNLRNRALMKNGKMIELTQVEFQIMEYFFSNPNTALDRIDILNHVWGDAYVGEDKIVDVNIRRLRMKVEDEPSNPKHIITVWGLGYKWDAGE